MPTNKPRITAYVKPDNYAKFKKFCKKNRVKLSSGIDLILTQFFGGDTPDSTSNARSVTLDNTLDAILENEKFQSAVSGMIGDRLSQHTSNTQSTIKANINGINQRLEVLEDGLKKALRLGYENEALRQKLETLEQQIELVGGLPSEAPSSQPEGITKATLSPIKVQSDLYPETIPDELLKGLFTAELAKRLGVDSSTVNKHQKRGEKHFATWTKEARADPDGIAWKFGGTRRKPGQKHESKFYVPLTVEEFTKLMKG